MRRRIGGIGGEVQLFAAIDRALSDADGVVLSDYGKGVLSPRVVGFAIERARAARIPVDVDPKSEDFRRYRGASCITPNLRELAFASHMPVESDAEVVTAATKVMNDAEAAAILVTRAEKGMVLVEASGAVHFEASRAREVFDVSGAGDTVIGILALAHGSGLPLASAMRRANTAAGIVVSKLGTATVELDELMLERSRDIRDEDWHSGKTLYRGRSRGFGSPLARSWPHRGLYQRMLRYRACRPHRLARCRAPAMQPPDRRAEHRCQHATPRGAAPSGNPLRDRCGPLTP